MNKLLSLVVSLALLPGAVFAASTPDCVKVNKAQIEALFEALLQIVGGDKLIIPFC